MSIVDARPSYFIPVELITEILSRLPARLLGRFKCVSKEWHDLISHRSFIRLHQRRSKQSNPGCNVLLIGHPLLYSFDFEHPQNPVIELPDPEINTEGSNILDWLKLHDLCSGLLFLSCGEVEYFMVYIPVTRTSKRVPFPKADYKNAYGDLRTHFFYDHVSDDYKVYYNFKDSTDHGKGGHWVFSLEANSWKQIEYHKCKSVAINYEGGVVNNHIHWTRPRPKKGRYSLRRFNISTEEYDIVQPEYLVSKPRLAVVRDKLHVITESLGLWVWKEYGIKESWTLLFRYPSNPMKFDYPFTWPSPIVYSKNGRKILVTVEADVKKLKFISCDMETKEATEVEFLGLPENDEECQLSAEPWVDSLVSP